MKDRAARRKTDETRRRRLGYDGNFSAVKWACDEWLRRRGLGQAGLRQMDFRGEARR